MTPDVNYIWGLSATDNSERLMVKLYPTSRGKATEVALNLDSQQLEPLGENEQAIILQEPMYSSNEYQTSLGFLDDSLNWKVTNNTSLIINQTLTIPEVVNYTLNPNDFGSFVSEKFDQAYLMVRMNDPSTSSEKVFIVISAIDTDSTNQFVSSTDLPYSWDQYRVYNEEQILFIEGRTSCNDEYYLYFNETNVDYLAQSWDFSSLVFDHRSDKIIITGTTSRNKEYFHYVHTVEYPSLNRVSWNITQSNIDEFFEDNTMEINFSNQLVLVSALIFGLLHQKRRTSRKNRTI
jgi:hypothetical protein